MERLGILGGTFDPPHNGHLALAAGSLRPLHLSGVLWVLTPDPPHKDRPDLTPYPLRRNMLQAATGGNPAYTLCEVELERPGPHYMTDTIRILHQRNPSAEFTLLLGEDSLRDLPDWHRPQDLLRLCRLAVMRRSGAKADMVLLESVLPGIGSRTTFLDSAPMDVSSTEIRDRVKHGESIGDLVPGAVAKIIHRESLYRSA
jgi:nicotinate-nucleotide adenylyltransferase